MSCVIVRKDMDKAAVTGIVTQKWYYYFAFPCAVGAWEALL